MLTFQVAVVIGLTVLSFYLATFVLLRFLLIDKEKFPEEKGKKVAIAAIALCYAATLLGVLLLIEMLFARFQLYVLSMIIP